MQSEQLEKQPSLRELRKQAANIEKNLKMRDYHANKHVDISPDIDLCWKAIHAARQQGLKGVAIEWKKGKSKELISYFKYRKERVHFDSDNQRVIIEWR